MEDLTRKITVTYLDPDATDSSSDEKSAKTHKNSKRKVHEIILQKVKISQENNNFRQKGTISPKSHLVGVHRRRSGKYSSEIKDPFTKRKIWLGTFGSEEEASKAYLAKKREFQKKLRAKQGSKSNWVSREKSESDQNSPSSVLEMETSDSSNFGENKVAGDEEVRFGFLCGVQIVDQNGFLVGEFSKLDDLSICTVGDGVFCQDVSFDVK
ncbi:hypothetical protein BUALT_Bualt05G0128900 [Buddleja alternifolia]|uniref:AP2/ERF domain-containing protein n=1 Tax=Buddleja alternifolia TaxID=168488 RepID=A0AAV6XIU1_9LAMI|nr:hypothetical protein BUALT_Bualt05G0128900 [Buddleja alternifolia]